MSQVVTENGYCQRIINVNFCLFFSLKVQLSSSADWRVLILMGELAERR